MKVYAESAKPALLKSMIEDFMDGEELDDTIEQTWSFLQIDAY